MRFLEGMRSPLCGLRNAFLPEAFLVSTICLRIAKALTSALMHRLWMIDFVINILLSCAGTNMVNIQSTLVISNSLISNNRLSRCENLVPAET